MAFQSLDEGFFISNSIVAQAEAGTFTFQSHDEVFFIYKKEKT